MKSIKYISIICMVSCLLLGCEQGTKNVATADKDIKLASAGMKVSDSQKREEKQVNKEHLLKNVVNVEDLRKAEDHARFSESDYERLYRNAHSLKQYIRSSDGVVLFAVPHDKLFRSGKYYLSPGGKTIIKGFSRLLNNHCDKNYRMMVVGSFYDGQNETEKFIAEDGNSGRALSVVYELMENGITPMETMAIGTGTYNEGGKFHPETGTALKAGRTEIILVPADFGDNEFNLVVQD